MIFVHIFIVFMILFDHIFVQNNKKSHNITLSFGLKVLVFSIYKIPNNFIPTVVSIAMATVVSIAMATVVSIAIPSGPGGI